MPGIILGVGNIAVNKTDKIVCLHVAYILVKEKSCNQIYKIETMPNSNEYCGKNQAGKGERVCQKVRWDDWSCNFK